MIIPKDKQDEFVRYYDQIMRPTWIKFGATKCELFKSFREKVAGENNFPEEQFVEILYLQEDLTAKDFFGKVKASPEAWGISRRYEKQFGAKDIVMKVLRKV
jgi:hypothetical protein